MRVHRSAWPGRRLRPRFFTSKRRSRHANIAVHGDELGSRVPRAEVVGPSAEKPVQAADDNRQVYSHLGSTGEGLDPGPGSLHGAHRRPAMQVVANNTLLLPKPTRHAGTKMTPEEVKAFPALSEIDHTGLVRVQGRGRRVAQLQAAGPPRPQPGSCRAPRSRPRSGRLRQHPAQPETSRSRTGASYRALRRLPGRDLHPLAWRSFEDAPWCAS